MSISLNEKAYTTIRQKIIRCEYMPESILSIYKLAEDLEMSRTPISNAIARLELEGFVVALKNRGVMVKTISSKEVIDMFEVLFAHQMYVLDTVIDYQFYTFDLEELKRILDQQLKAKADDQYFEYASLSLSFFRSFIATVKNNTMLQIMDAHLDKILMTSVANYKLHPQQRMFSGAHYNAAIYEALAQKDYEQARKLVKEWRIQMRERVMMVGVY